MGSVEETKSDDKNKEADMGREEQEESKMVKKIENKVAKDKKKVAQEAMIESEQKEKAFPFGKKLKKAETVKLQIKETKLEIPKLKHHEFENIPKDTDEEQLSNIKLSKLIKTENEESKVKKEETKRKLKKKKAKTPVQDVVEPMDMEEEETMPVEQQEYEEIPQEIVKDISSPDVVKEDLSEIPSKDDISNANVESVPQKDITEKEDSNINIQQIPQDFVSDNEAKSDDKNKEADMGKKKKRVKGEKKKKKKKKKKK